MSSTSQRPRATATTTTATAVRLAGAVAVVVVVAATTTTLPYFLGSGLVVSAFGLGESPVRSSAFAGRTTTTSSTQLRQAFALVDGVVSTTDVPSTVKSISASVDAFFQTQPYLSAFLTCSFKAGTADLVAQQRRQQQQQMVAEQDGGGADAEVEGAEEQQYSFQAKSAAVEEDRDDDDNENETGDNSAEVNVQQNMAFVLYGGLYQGLFQEFLYNGVFPRLFAPFGDGWQTLAAQVALDMLVVTPLLCLPVAYVFKSAFVGDETTASSRETTANAVVIDDDNLTSTYDSFAEATGSAVRRGLQAYGRDVRHKELLQSYWKIWVPVQTLTFGVVPHHFRIAFVACVSFFWVFVLSTISSSSSDSSSSDTSSISESLDATTTATSSSTAAATSAQR